VLFEKITPLCDKGKQLLLFGDLNGRIGSMNTYSATRTSCDRTTNHRGKILFHHISANGLLIANGTTPGDLSGQSTSVSQSVAGSSVVDLLLYSPSCSPYISQFNVLNLCYSDHFPIAATFDTPSVSSNLTYSTTQFALSKIILPTEPIKNRIFRQKLESSLSEIQLTDDFEALTT